MKRLKVSAVVIATLTFVSQISAGFIDITGGFNVVTLGNFSLENSEISGSVASGGNVTISNGFGINNSEPLQTAAGAIVANGNVKLSNNGQVHGSIFASGSVTKDASVTVSGNINNGYSPLPFSPSYADANELSDLYVTSTPSNAWELLDGNTTLVLNGVNEFNYYNVSATELQSVWALKILDQSKYSIVNVHGNSAVLHYNKMNHQTSDLLNSSRILFNFVDASDVTIGSVYGNVLAKDAKVSGQWGHMNGVLFANSFHGAIEFGMSDFNPPNDVPESSTVAMMIIGLFCLSIVSKKRFSLQR
jgi:choice-of-anchor A domain-containing protein